MNILRCLALSVLLLTVNIVQADELMMARIDKPFEEAMLTTQDIIKVDGYQVMRVQRVDVGLKSRGFDTAEYRVVFFGKYHEIKTLSEKYPALMPYLPLKLTLIAEGSNTLAVTNNPRVLSQLFPDAELQPYFKRWEQDVQDIFDSLMSH